MLKTLKLAATLGAAMALPFLATSVRANSIYEIGDVSSASPANPSDELGYMDELIAAYNGATPGADVTLNVGSAVPPAPLEDPTVNDGHNTPTSGQGGNGASLTVTVPDDATYLSVKWGDSLEGYFVEGLAGQTITVTPDFSPGNGDSHFDWYEGGGVASAPDGGMTLAFLSGSSICLAALRRKLAK